MLLNMMFHAPLLDQKEKIILTVLEMHLKVEYAIVLHLTVAVYLY